MLDLTFGLTTFQVFSLYIFICAAFMYIVIMGPSRFHRNGVVGWMHRKLMDAPRGIVTAILLPFCCCSWSRASRSWVRIEDRIMNKKHPGMLIFYVLLIGSAEYFYLSFTVPRLPTFERKAFSWFLIVVSEVFFVWACAANPGTVTPAELLDVQKTVYNTENVKFSSPEFKKKKKLFMLSPIEEQKQNRRYVIDDILYAMAKKQEHDVVERIQPPPHGLSCTTCQVPRPARSKHCKLCGHCVRRFDHHCPWINNDVGEHNHRIFLAFLLSHVISCYWATFDGYSVLMDFVLSRRLLGAIFMDGAGKRIRANWSHIALYVVNQETVICCVFLFTALIGTLLLGFWAYQMRMVLMNLTSNDLNKIDDVMEFVYQQPSAADVRREAEYLAETIFRWTGRTVVLPAFPDTLDATPVRRVKQPAEDATAAIEEVTAAAAARAPLSEEQKKASRAYRKSVEKALNDALKKTFHSGSIIRNLREVLFPYEDTLYHHLWTRVLAPKAARKERLYGNLVHTEPNLAAAAAKQQKKRR